MSTATVEDEKIVYKRKSGKYSSHEIILRMISGTGNVLDLGSSNGILYNDLVRRGFNVTCVDMEAPDRVKIPPKDYVHCNLEQFEKLNFDKKYDYIILADVIEHLRNAPDLLSYIGSFLKEDGVIIISVPNIAVWVYRLSLLFGFFDYTEKGTLDETHVRFYTKKTLLGLMEKRGYRVETFSPTVLPSEVVIGAVFPKILISIFDRLYFSASKFWPSLLAYQFVIKVKNDKK